jgi:AraC-like DNA-binding protein
MKREKSYLDYHKTVLKPSITVNSIVTVHYFEYSSSYYFPGEAHDFWEFLYVDKGEVLVSANTAALALKAGEIIFHQPMEFHTVGANGVVAPNLAVVAFDCRSPAMDFFRNKVMRVTQKQHSYIADIVEIAYQLFDSPLNDPELKRLTKRKDNGVPFGSEQILRSTLELLLLDMIRNDQPPLQRTAATAFRREYDLELYLRTLRFFEEHLREQLSLEEICDALLVGRSHLQKLFHEKTGSGVVDNFARMKIQYARQIIREGRLNFTETAEYLGYSSLYYFSRQFKKITGMTPTQYSQSIQAKAHMDEHGG